MPPLRILHITPYFSSAWAYGGIPRVVTAISQAQARAGHTVTVCTTDVRDRHERAVGNETDDGGPEVLLFPNLSNRLAYHLQFYTPQGLSRFLRAQGHRFDVAHVHGCHHLLGTIAARRLERHGVPWVLEPHGTARPIERRILAKRVFAATFGRRTLTGARALIAVSQVEREDLQAMGIDNVEVVPNPIELPDRPPAAPTDDGTFRVLYLGKLTPRKCVPTLIQAAATLGDSRLRIEIAGPDMGSEAECRRLSRRLGLDTHFRGVLSGQDRFAALRRADAVFYATRDEAFGLVPFEALLSGTPAIVSRGSGAAEYLEQTGAVSVVPAAEPEPLSRAIAELMADRRRGRRLAREAAGWIRRNFAAEKIAGRLEDVYRGAMMARAA